MKWILIAVGILVVGVLVIVVIGALLPREHVVAMVSAHRSDARPCVVGIDEPSGIPELAPRRQIGRHPRAHGARPVMARALDAGAITFVVDAAEPSKRLVTRIADEHLPFGGSWEYVVEPDGPSSSRVTIVERGAVYNPLFRFVSRFIMGHTATIDAYLRALGKRFGAEPTPTIVAPAGDTHGI
jgi:hypothetical protein